MAVNTLSTPTTLNISYVWKDREARLQVSAKMFFPLSIYTYIKRFVMTAKGSVAFPWKYNPDVSAIFCQRLQSLQTTLCRAAQVPQAWRDDTRDIAN